MNRAALIALRELYAYVRSPLGAVIVAAMLLIDGVWFMSQALGAGARLSADVLAEFFHGASGTTMIAAIALSMRGLALEREKGTLVVLTTSPATDAEIVVGKFAAIVTLLAFATALSVYMPVLVLVNGRVSWGHIAVGYLGVLLLGAASAAIGVFASALARSQVVAGIVGAVVLGVLLMMWMLARKVDPPLSGLLAGLALHHEHQRAFMTGVLAPGHVAYYLGVTYVFLFAADPGARIN